MKILLLGARGQLGRSILRANAKLPAPFDIAAPGRQKLNLENADEIRPKLEGLNFDALVNCTGFHQVDEVELKPELAFTVNAYAVRELARACEQQGARLVHVSTDFVYGGDETVAEPLTELNPAAPVNAYGATKFVGERLAAAACRDTVTLRVATLYGLGGMSRSRTNFVESILRKAQKGQEFPVVDDQTVSPTSADDAADAILELLRLNTAPGTYHAVNSGHTTRHGFAREILRQAKLPGLARPCTSEEFPTPAKRPKFSALDNKKIGSAVMPFSDWQDALSRYLSARARS